MSPFISALVFKSVNPVPAPGSDILTATTISPLQTLGMTLFFRASVAKCCKTFTGPAFASKTGQPTAEEIFPNSSRIIIASKFVRPWPPYSVGVFTPRKPISPIFIKASLGTGSPVSSNSSARAGNSFCAYSRATFWSSNCSEVNLKSIVIIKCASNYTHWVKISTC